MNFAAVRAAVDAPFTKQMMVPLDRLFKVATSKHIRAFATDVDAASKTVAFQPLGVDGKPSGEPASLQYDFLVIATGTKQGAPMHPSTTKAETKAGMVAINDAIKAAQSVVVIGGGATGIELAGEIKEAFSSKTVTLVHRGKALLDSAVTGLTPEFSKRMLAEVAAAGIVTHLGVSVDIGAVTSAPGVSAVAGSTNVFAGSQSVGLGGDKSVSADLVIIATGGKPNSGWLKASASLSPALDKAGYITTELTYQVKGHSNVFAIGDVAGTPDAKSGWVTNGQASIVAANIAKLAGAKAGGGSPTLKQSKAAGIKGIGLIPVGKNHGAALVPFGIVKFPVGFKTKVSEVTHVANRAVPFHLMLSRCQF